MSCSTCKKGCNKQETPCPLCGSATHKVIAEEVFDMVKDSVRPYVHGTHYHLCDNEDCEVVFYSMDPEEILLTQDINKYQILQEEKNIESENL
jgi:transposase